MKGRKAAGIVSTQVNRHTFTKALGWEGPQLPQRAGSKHKSLDNRIQRTMEKRLLLTCTTTHRAGQNTRA